MGNPPGLTYIERPAPPYCKGATYQAFPYCGMRLTTLPQGFEKGELAAGGGGYHATPEGVDAGAVAEKRGQGRLQGRMFGGFVGHVMEVPPALSRLQ